MHATDRVLMVVMLALAICEVIAALFVCGLFS